MKNSARFSAGRRRAESTRRSRTAFFLAAMVGCWIVSMTLGHAAEAAAMVSAKTGDTNANGRIDRIWVTFSTPMNASVTPKKSAGPGSPGFWVEGYEIQALSWDQTNTTLMQVNLVEGPAADTAATPAVHYEAGGDAFASVPPQDVELQPGTVRPIDGAGPVLLGVKANDQGSWDLFNSVGDELQLTFSESATLAGASPLDRWSNLDRALRFTNNGGGCGSDGNGTPSSFNLPQPGGATAADETVVSPAPASATGRGFATHWSVRQQASSKVSAAGKMSAVPGYCYVGIDASATSVITDAANNIVRSQDEPSTASRRYFIEIADTTVVSARTVDAAGGAPDGTIDAVDVTFDHPIIDSTVSASMFTLSLGGDAVAASSFSSGATENDATIRLGIVPPSATAWNTGARPMLRYTKPATCASAGGAGVRATVPSGSSYFSCVATTSMQVADGAAPARIDSMTGDANANGLLDQVVVTFSEPIAAASSGWKINGANAAAVAIDAADASKVKVSFAEGTVGDTNLRPILAYQAQPAASATKDSAENHVMPFSRTTDRDGAAPRIRRATAYDLDADGSIERVVLKYSEPLATVGDSTAAAFAFGSAAGTGIAAPAAGDDDPDVANDEFVSIAFAAEGTAARDLTFSAATGIGDLAGNLSSTQTVVAADVLDAAPPVAALTMRLGTEPATNKVRAGTWDVRATYSEPMNTSVAPTVVLGSTPVQPAADLSHELNGWSRNDSTVWDGTIAIPASTCTVRSGCPASVTASGAKEQRTLTQRVATLEIDIDTIAPEVLSIAGFSAAMEPGESAPADVLNMFATDFTLNATVNAGDAEGGTAQLLLDGNPLSPDAVDGAIDGDDTSISPKSGFGDADALQAAVDEGAHVLTIRICDDALNCATSLPSHTITADYTPVPVTLSTPNGGEILRGGSTETIAWDGDETAAGFDRVDLSLSSDDGATFETVATEQAVEGSFQWSVPEIDTAEAVVRAVSVDENGNKAFDISEATFVIDSTAPNVTLRSPSSRFPFVPRGGTATIEWTAQDASLDRVSAPITIEYSTNDGASWQPINGGSYGKGNDGSEVWQVPNIASTALRVRVTAADAVSLTGDARSARIASGIAGYLAEADGDLVAWGTADRNVQESKRARGDWVRGVAFQSRDRSGYVLSSRGYLYPFRVGDERMPSRPRTTKLRGDRARGVVLRTNTSGYVLDMSGKLYRFGGAPSVRLSKSWRTDRARAVVMRSDKRGGYVLDAYGRMHPFAVGRYRMPPRAQSSNLWSKPYAVGVVLASNQRSGWILDKYGNLRPFGGAPRVSNPHARRYGAAKAIVATSRTGGYWSDHRGGLHPWGSMTAIGASPSRARLAWNTARAAASL